MVQIRISTVFCTDDVSPMMCWNHFPSFQVTALSAPLAIGTTVIFTFQIYLFLPSTGVFPASRAPWWCHRHLILLHLIPLLTTPKSGWFAVTSSSVWMWKSNKIFVLSFSRHFQTYVRIFAQLYTSGSCLLWKALSSVAEGLYLIPQCCPSGTPFLTTSRTS